MTNTAIVVAILTGVIGFMVGTLLEFFKHWLTVKRDREARAAEEREAREARAAEQRETRVLRQNQFQRETLLALQTASESLIDAALESGRSWGNSRLEAALEASRAFWRADALFNTLHVRVRDWEVKLACLHLVFVCVAIGRPNQGSDGLTAGAAAFLSKSEGETSVMEKFKELQDSVGKVLATLDALDESA